VSLPAALRRSVQRRLSARPPSSTASLEPTVSVPVGSESLSVVVCVCVCVCIGVSCVVRGFVLLAHRRA
jgi:hypothetical protein